MPFLIIWHSSKYFFKILRSKFKSSFEESLSLKLFILSSSCYFVSLEYWFDFYYMIYSLQSCQHFFAEGWVDTAFLCHILGVIQFLSGDSLFHDSGYKLQMESIDCKWKYKYGLANFGSWIVGDVVQVVWYISEFACYWFGNINNRVIVNQINCYE